MLSASLLLSLCLAAEPAYVVDLTPAGRVRATLHYEGNGPKIAADEWLIFVPVVPELPGQRQVKSSTQPAGALARDLSPADRPVQLIRVKPSKEAEKTGFTVDLNIEATLDRRLLRQRRSGEPAPTEQLSPKERAAALVEYADFEPKSKAVRQWLDKHDLWRKEGENEVDLARRIFLAIRKHYSYEYLPVMDRRASHVCESDRSDCGGLAILFISAMRANDVPARMRCGRWAISSKAGDRLGVVPYHQWHVKAEFFAEGTGWVPLDLSSSILHDRSAAGMQFFGVDPGDFLTFHLDTHFLVDTIHFGREQLPNLQSPHFWVTGQGEFEPFKTEQQWTVTRVR